MNAHKYHVLKGAESIYIEGGKTGIVLSHGFIGTPQSVEVVAEKLADAGYTVYAPRLTGHGTHPVDLDNTTRADWIEDILDACHVLHQVCSSVYVAGQSMGGALALQAAARLPWIAGVLTINAAIDVPWMKRLTNKQPLGFIQEGGADIAMPDVYEIAYEQVSLRAMKELVLLGRETKALLNKVNCPAEVLVSEVDHVVPPNNSGVVFESISSPLKNKTILRNSYHVATMDYDQQKIVQTFTNWIEKTNRSPVKALI
ncbi:carboxylesterase [Salsuginibacillus halophilus]|uniref:Carboxylesterase n=1 Tax=Salsuginibacillus halophilus TaxID=517424 RepID=A0A2P8HWV2_9BACI|nr:alpha/beta fold hydrolase [Salsuginibacillus halophilus]PSL50625.1 carboxylesterase [Salsuginibacillus halophilus]